MKEYFYRGERRCLWVTASTKLFGKVKDDVSAVFMANPNVAINYSTLAEFQKRDNSKMDLLQITYRDLVETRNAKRVEDWLVDDNYDGLVIIFLIMQHFGKLTLLLCLPDDI